MKKKILNALLFTSAFSVAQTSLNNSAMPLHRTCGTSVPSAQWDAWFNQKVTEYVQNNAAKFIGSSNSTASTSYTIPVVVHVIHGGQAVGTYPNITNAQAVSQISILQNDFDGVGQYTSHYPANAFQNYATANSIPSPNYNGSRIVIGNAQLTFLPAYYDKNGNAMPEPGIERINFNTFTLSGGYTSKDPSNAAYNTPTTFMNFLNNIVKPQTIWNPVKYMNIWVTDENSSTGLLGFATFPAGSTLTGMIGGTGTSTTDGLWCWAMSYGNTGFATAPYNLGRTATHEIGHWVGLRHIWGDATCATDYCNDTPPAYQANYVNQNPLASPPTAADANTVTYPYNVGTCSGPPSNSPDGEMFMNFMDYSDDNGMFMFTTDQVTRIQTAMANAPYRNQLGTHGLTIPYPTANFNTSVLSPCTNQTVQITDMSTGTVSAPSSWNYTITGATTSTSNVQNPVVTFTATGTQTITLICAANGTQVSLPFTKTVTVGPGITVSLTSSAAGTVCAGTSVTLSASGAGTYTWSTGSNAGSIIVTPTTTTIYNVTGSSGACSATKTTTVNVGAGINVSISASSASLCTGQSATLSAFGASSYTWSTGSNLSSIVVTPLSSTTYTLVGKTGACSGNTTTAITVNTTPTVSVNSATICNGTSATLTASGATTFSWSTGATGTVLNPSPASNTVYTVIGANGNCTNSKTSSVTVVANPTVNVTNPTICAGSSATITASGATTFSWNTGSTASSIVVSPLSTTQYTVKGSNGICASSKVATVTANPIPTLTVNSYTICSGGTATLTVSGASTYSWSTGSTASSINVSPVVTTVYSVVGTSLGCSSSKTSTVTIGSSLSISFSSPATSICNGGSTTITASGASSYTWNTGSNANSIVVSPVSNTTYSIIGSNGSCFGSNSIGITVNSLPSSSVVPSNALCNGSATGSVSVSSSGNAPFTYAYSPSGPSALTAGNYSVTTTDANGCKVKNTFTITQPSAISAAVSTSATSCPASCNGKASILASGGTGVLTYSIIPAGGTGSSVSNLCAGTFTYITTDANGCKNNSVFTINPGTGGLTATATSTNASCPTCTNGAASVTNSGTAPFTYTWQPGGYNSANVSNLAVGCYTVMVTDANNCTGSATTCIVSVVTGIQNNTNTEDVIRVMPNPNNGVFTIEFGTINLRSIDIIDLTGRIIVAKQVNVQSIELSISEFSSGIYYLRVKDTQGIKIIKLIKN
ncbi:MAG: T9SS type A sorting domain-containing protein [Bacteroidetes bacterium]|nr:T9SS type A sorting domain-containing protein [Bacteroidota bacterium]